MMRVERQPTARDVRVFGLLWLVFFCALGLLAWWRPAALLGAAAFVGLATTVALLLGGVPRGRRRPAALLPSLFVGAGALGLSGAPAALVVGLLVALGVGGAAVVLLAPALGARLWTLWMRAAAPVGWTVSHVILAIVYYGVLTPVGFIMRLTGYDPMRRAFERNAETYWIARREREDAGRYFRQWAAGARRPRVSRPR
jgi:hypothetical protein